MATKTALQLDSVSSEKDDMSCAECGEEFKNLKALPCRHRFCESCVKAVEKDKGTLTCPTCTKQGRLPGGGLSQPKENVFFKVLSAIKQQRILEGDGEAQQKTCDACQKSASYICPTCKLCFCTTCLQPHEVIPQTKGHKVLTVAQYRKEKRKNPADSKVYCKTHHGKEIHTYCDTCDDLVCQVCVVVNGPHVDHVFKDLKVAADEFIKQLKDMIEKLGGQKTEANRGVRVVKENKTKLDIQSQVEKKNVECKGKEMAEAVELETKRLLAKVEEEYGKRLVTAKNELEEWCIKGERISKACSDIETLIHHGNSAQLLSAREDAITHIEDLLNIDVKSENPEFIKFKPFDDHSQHDLLGWLTSGPEVRVPLCTVRMTHAQFWTGDLAKVVVTTKDSEGNPIIASEDVVAKVQKQDESPWEDVPVTDNGDGTHTVTVHCQVAGKYQLSIEIGGHPVPGSSFEIPVHTGLMKTIGPEKNQLPNPTAVSINKYGDLVIADSGARYGREIAKVHVTTLDERYQSDLEFNKIHDIAVSADNEYFMTNITNKQCIVSDEYGRETRRIGENELVNPRHIAISPVDGSIYVSDTDGSDTQKPEIPHCIRKYQNTGNYIKSFGKYGSGNGEFKVPSYLAVNNQGMLYVSDYGNYRIQVFDADCKFLFKFGTYGKDDCNLDKPSGIAIDNDGYVYVADTGNGWVKKFDSKGRFESTVGDKLGNPLGVAVTDDVPCRVVVTDSSRVKVFAQ